MAGVCRHFYRHIRLGSPDERNSFETEPWITQKILDNIHQRDSYLGTFKNRKKVKNINHIVNYVIKCKNNARKQKLNTSTTALTKIKEIIRNYGLNLKIFDINKTLNLIAMSFSILKVRIGWIMLE